MRIGLVARKEKDDIIVRDCEGVELGRFPNCTFKFEKADNEWYLVIYSGGRFKESFYDGFD